ncbi:MAG: hypothetical protein WC399_02870 [Bacilli bacterium]|jgi:hypothetical protein
MKTQRLFCLIATFIVGLTTLGAASYRNFIEGEREAQATSYYTAKDTFQCNNVRYDGGWPNGITVNYYEDGWTFPADIANMSYGRVILEAVATATYTIGIEYGAWDSYPVKVFVNGVSADYTFSSNGGSASTYDLSLALNQGKNVFIIAMLKWGVINKMSLPDGVTVFDNTVSGSTYTALGAESQATKLKVVTKTIHDHDAVIYTEPLQYNSNSSYASMVNFSLDTETTTKSLELSYHSATNTDGLATVQLKINASAGFNVDLYETANGVVGTKIITSDVLTSNGFVSGSLNTVSITKPLDNSDSIGLVSMTLSDETTSTHTVTRVEAENATMNGGSKHTGADPTKFSNAGYVGDMGTKTTLSGPEQISADLSNVNSLSFSYSAAADGIYSVYVRYGDGADNQAYVRSDLGPWASVSLKSSTWWDTCRVAVAEVFMNAGTRTITLTGTTNADGWVNYDFVDIIQNEALTVAETALNYATFFRNQTSSGCSAQNVTLIPWAQLKSEYLALSNDVQNEYAVSTQETIVDARARYLVLIEAYPTLAADNWLVDGSDDLVYELSLPIEYAEVNHSSATIFALLALAAFCLSFIYFKTMKTKEE